MTPSERIGIRRLNKVVYIAYGYGPLVHEALRYLESVTPQSRVQALQLVTNYAQLTHSDRCYRTREMRVAELIDKHYGRY